MPRQPHRCSGNIFALYIIFLFTAPFTALAVPPCLAYPPRCPNHPALPHRADYSPLQGRPPLHGGHPDANVNDILQMAYSYCWTTTIYTAETHHDWTDHNSLSVPQQLRLFTLPSARDQLHAAMAVYDEFPEYGGRLLVEAAEAGASNVVQALLELGVPAMPKFAYYREESQDGIKSCPALEIAAEKGHLDVIRILVHAGVRPDGIVNDFVHPDGCVTPLKLAARHGKREVVDWLLSAGSDPGWRGDPEEASLIECAALSGDLATAVLALRVSDPKNTGLASSRINSQALINAARSGNEEIVEMMLRQGLYPTDSTKGPWKGLLLTRKRSEAILAAFREASGYGHVAAARLLYSYLAPPGQVDFPSHQSLRAYANGGMVSSARRNDTEAYKFFESVADPHAHSGTQRTAWWETTVPDPLAQAALVNAFDMVRFLVEERGADVNRCKWSYWESESSALGRAAEGGHVQLVEYLLSVGAEVDGRGRRSPIWLAVRAGHPDVVRVLLEHGALVSEVASDGMPDFDSGGCFLDVKMECPTDSESKFLVALSWGSENDLGSLSGMGSNPSECNCVRQAVRLRLRPQDREWWRKLRLVQKPVPWVEMEFPGCVI